MIRLKFIWVLTISLTTDGGSEEARVIYSNPYACEREVKSMSKLKDGFRFQCSKEEIEVWE